MKRITIIGVLLLVTLSIFGVVTLTPKNTNATSTYIVGAPPKTQQDLVALGKMGIQLNEPAQPAKVSKDVALQTALKTWTNAANKEYSIEYQILTEPGFNAFSPEALEKNPTLKAKNAIDHLPVYIISFKKVPIANHRSAANNVIPERELNIVVDAESGVCLTAFAYR